MRPDPREDYVRDVPYPRKFVPQIAPPLLRLVAALNGLATPPEDDFDYCELGSASGDTLALLAAANPGGRFVGVHGGGALAQNVPRVKARRHFHDGDARFRFVVQNGPLDRRRAAILWQQGGMHVEASEPG